MYPSPYFFWLGWDSFQGSLRRRFSHHWDVAPSLSFSCHPMMQFPSHSLASAVLGESSGLVIKVEAKQVRPVHRVSLCTGCKGVYCSFSPALFGSCGSWTGSSWSTRPWWSLPSDLHASELCKWDLSLKWGWGSDRCEVIFSWQWEYHKYHHSAEAPDI